MSRLNRSARSRGSEHPGEGPWVPAPVLAQGDARERLASPAAPEARMRPHAILDFPALLRAQDRGRVSDRLHDALAGGIDERDLLCAQGLDGGTVDRGRQQEVVGALARGMRLLA